MTARGGEHGIGISLVRSGHQGESMSLEPATHEPPQSIANQPSDDDRDERDECIHNPSPELGIGQVLIKIFSTDRESCGGMCACKKAPIGEAVEDVLR